MYLGHAEQDRLLHARLPEAVRTCREQNSQTVGN